MIRRIYADNYKCLVDFTCEFDNLNLILGTNGNGKSTVFDVLRDIRAFVTGSSPIGIFNDSTRTRWLNSNLQTIEVEIEGNGGVYLYHLEIEHESAKDKQRVKLENVTFNGVSLYKAELGEVYLYRDNGTEGGTYPKDRTQSGLPILGEQPDNTKITWFKNWLREKLLILKIEPARIEKMWSGEETELDESCSNFVGYYRHLIQAQPSAMVELFGALKEMYDGFVELRLDQEGGNVRHLKAIMGVEENNGRLKNVSMSFGEFSDGERSLIILYVLLYLMNDPETTLCLDEPDNYVALAEIQPWLAELRDRIDAYSSQALLISHHPQLIDYLAPACGLVLEREKNGSTIVKRFNARNADDNFTPSELVARGWE